MKKIFNLYKKATILFLTFAPSFIAMAARDGVSAGGGSFSGKLDNPISVGSFPDFIALLLKIAVQIGFPVAVLFIIYSGFLFVKAQGNEKELETAKKALTWTIIGTAVLLGASVLSYAIQNTINQLK